MRAILTYHSVDRTGSVISTDPAVFRRQLAWLARGPVTVVRLEQLLTIADDTDAVAITFDDGFRNFRAEAAEPLLDHGLPSTLFVATGRVGTTNEWVPGGEPGIPILPLLDWDELGAVAERGVAIGAHTRTHPRLAQLSADRVEAEVVGAAEDIQARLGMRPTAFAYPYGSVGDASVRLARSTYASACTTELRPLRASDDHALLPRLDMFYLRESGQLEAWGTARFRLRLKMRAHARAARGRVASFAGRS
jgi:peptidoglycan/xylan/chitin deacetylase (PgdA/CDA1 family)